MTTPSPDWAEYACDSAARLGSVGWGALRISALLGACAIVTEPWLLFVLWAMLSHAGQ